MLTLHKTTSTLRCLSLARHFQACLDTIAQQTALPADARPGPSSVHLQEAGWTPSARPSTAAALLHHPRGFASAAAPGGSMGGGVCCVIGALSPESNHVVITGVTVVESDEQFRKIMAEHQGKKPCIVDFYAIWCGPWYGGLVFRDARWIIIHKGWLPITTHSRQISPYFEELSRTYSGLRFLKVDVDKLNQVTAEASVNAVPAFQVWKDGAIVDEFVGASKEDLKALCEKHAAGWS